jgi:hypothetical protein
MRMGRGWEELACLDRERAFGVGGAGTVIVLLWFGGKDEGDAVGVESAIERA